MFLSHSSSQVQAQSGSAASYGNSTFRFSGASTLFSIVVGVQSPSRVSCSPSGSSVHGTLQARTLEWVAISFSRGSSRPRDGTCVSVPPAPEAGSLPWSCQAPCGGHTSLHSQQQCRSHPVYFNQRFTSWSGCRVGGGCQGIWYRATVSQGDFFLSLLCSVSSLCCYGAEDFVCLFALT